MDIDKHKNPEVLSDDWKVGFSSWEGTAQGAIDHLGIKNFSGVGVYFPSDYECLVVWKNGKKEVPKDFDLTKADNSVLKYYYGTQFKGIYLTLISKTDKVLTLGKLKVVKAQFEKELDPDPTAMFVLEEAIKKLEE